MIRLLLWLSLMLVGSSLAVWAMQHQGYVALQWAGWLIETSASVLLLMVIFLAVLGYGLVRLLVTLWQLPQRFFDWRAGRRAQLPTKQLGSCVQALALNHDSFVDKLVAGRDESQWSRYLLAAQLAHAQHQSVQRDQLLAKALSIAPQQDFTIRLLQARWLLDEDADKALTIVDALLTHAPKQRTLKALRVEALAKSEQWAALAQYLPSAKTALSRSHYLALQEQLLAAELNSAQRIEDLTQAWSALDRSKQRQASLLLAYLQRAEHLGAEPMAQAFSLIAQSLNYRWDARLLPLLGKAVAHVDAYQALKQVRQWQVRYSQEAMLWWLSGLLANQQGMVAVAEQDWQQSLRLTPSIAAALALSDFYAQQAKPEAGRLLLAHQMQAQASGL